MWSRAAGISDNDLVNFTIKDDLVEVRSGPTSYGTIIFGKIRLPAVNDDLGEGFMHVRIHDPPNRVGHFSVSLIGMSSLIYCYRVLLMSCSTRCLLTRGREMKMGTPSDTRQSRQPTSLSNSSTNDD